MPKCIFCSIVQGEEPAQIVYEDPQSLAFLDKYPQSRGHLQLIPKKHYPRIYEIPEMGAFFTVAGRVIRAIIPVLGADHVTIATFGRQVTHAHLWIVPQYDREGEIKEGFGRKTTREEQKELVRALRVALKGV
ncbi:hypothetical protein A2973_05400 [Candidatus Gottesmanbacteria bacterium RIFCSPLOWO2_01_FULL_49_10]|uniref:HIT domain-containing protein n=1 Tax=Candidatus Gottesmanbacteria bacterium RIFCSPLOWO2_01_FULL_49_10 TaxID=1798396 RepID=A0A1F6B1B3_9BACT|nr:MAG: hypothetical protein A2973_05400 [Candidatus Gottesmanbacteria bacterium RIFCSPLOWO2_01_FULL_49_10]